MRPKPAIVIAVVVCGAVLVIAYELITTHHTSEQAQTAVVDSNVARVLPPTGHVVQELPSSVNDKGTSIKRWELDVDMEWPHYHSWALDHLRTDYRVVDDEASFLKLVRHPTGTEETIRIEHLAGTRVRAVFETQAK